MKHAVNNIINFNHAICNVRSSVYESIPNFYKNKKNLVPTMCILVPPSWYDYKNIYIDTCAYTTPISVASTYTYIAYSMFTRKLERLYGEELSHSFTRILLHKYRNGYYYRSILIKAYFDKSYWHGDIESLEKLASLIDVHICESCYNEFTVEPYTNYTNKLHIDESTCINVCKNRLQEYTGKIILLNGEYYLTENFMDKINIIIASKSSIFVTTDICYSNRYEKVNFNELGNYLKSSVLDIASDINIDLDTVKIYIDTANSYLTKIDGKYTFITPKIHSYHDWNWRNVVNKYANNEDKSMLLGVELETNGPTINSAYATNDIFHCEKDGSLEDDYSFEMISVPCSYNYWLSYKNQLDQLFATLKQKGQTNGDDGYGFHVHIDKKAFKNTKAIGRLIHMIRKFQSQFELLARRDDDYYYDYHANRDISLEDLQCESILDAYFNGHSSCVNTHIGYDRTKTVEIRIFKSTLNTDTFYATLELVKNMVDLANSDEDITDIKQIVHGDTLVSYANRLGLAL